MKKLVVLCLALSCFGLFFACAAKEDADTAQQNADRSHPEHKADIELAANIAVDPVCRTMIKKEEAVATAKHGDETYFFCLQEHKETFVANPAKYLLKLDLIEVDGAQ